LTILVPIALLLSILPASAWSQTNVDGAPVISPESWQTKLTELRPPNFSLQGAGSAATAPRDASTHMFASTEVSSYATVGFGLFGPKPERSLQSHVIGYDASRPRSRRVAMGVRLKF
jgi:hypothetical protein